MDRTKEGTRLPFELHLAIMEHGTAHLPPRTRSKRLAALSTVCRDWYHPARSLLFASPTLPADSIWLLSRTLRHDPRLASRVTAVDIYSIKVVGSPLLAALLTTCKHLKCSRLRFTKAAQAGQKAGWTALLDVLEAKRLDRLEWIQSGQEVGRCFSWTGIRDLTLYGRNSHHMDALRYDAHPKRDVKKLSLLGYGFPLGDLERRQSMFRSIQDLSLSSSNFAASDLECCLKALGSTIIRLSLTGLPAGLDILLPAAFAPLTSLRRLEVSGELVESSVFISLPPSVKFLCIVPGELHPVNLLYRLLTRKAGLAVGSEGLAHITVKFVDLHGRRDAKARTLWEAEKSLW